MIDYQPYWSIKNLIYEIKLEMTEDDIRMFRDIDSFIVNVAGDYIASMLGNNHEYLVTKIAVLPVSKYRAQIPGDLKKVIQIAGSFKKKSKKAPEYRNQLLAEVSRHGNCVKVIQKHCKCPESHCTHSIDITTDQLDFGFNGVGTTIAEGDTFNIFQRIHRGYDRDENGSCVSPLLRDFTLLRPSLNNFHLLRSMFVEDAINFEIDDPSLDNQFSLEPGVIITGFKEGLILLTYKGMLVDEYGVMMFPRVPELVTAIKTFIDWKVANYMYKFTKTQTAYLAARDAERRVAPNSRIAMSALRRIPWDKLVVAILQAKFANQIRTSFDTIVGSEYRFKGEPTNSIRELRAFNHKR